VAFASRLKGLLNYYLDSRYVTDFAKLCELLVCDRIKSTLPDSCLQYVLSIKSGTKEGWMPVEELTSSIDRYQSAHSAAGVPRAFAIGAFVPRKRCFECGSTRHFRQNCPQLLGKTAFKPQANVSRVCVGVLRNEPVILAAF